MRFPLVAGLAAVTLAAACGAYSFPGSSTETGHLSGTVLVYPCAPVEQADQPCKGKPGAGLEMVFTGSSGTSTATVDSAGRYAIDLAAGTWKVSVKGIGRIISGPPEVTITAGGSVVADYVVDSGMRVPVPPPN